MTDTRALPPEALAAIAERDTDDSIYGPFRDPFQRAARAGDDRRALLAHAAYLAERLELVTDERAQARELSTMARERLAEARAQLERERADHAATVADLHARSAVSQGLADDALTVTNMDLATERAARLLAEGQAAELRAALASLADESHYHKVTWDDDGTTYWFWDKELVDEPWDIAQKALASPDCGAGAVLAATDQLEADYEAWCKRPGDLEDFPDSVADLLEPFLAKVRAWRARRSGGTGG